MSRSRLAFTACAALVALVVPACTTTTAGGRTGRGSGSTVLHVGTLIEPNTLNPVGGTLVLESRVANLIYDGLIRVDDRGQPVPDLTTVVPSQANGGISRDGRTVTYHLAPNARWSDGTPVTARDVIFTWRAIMNPRNNVTTRVG
ncbi:MAG: hypothetical protein JO060_06810 [Candidatus Eremiobacteraeota bacterium]|nr:hypothetical protein [Candidatus Eremiobacteraeota bacterium]